MEELILVFPQMAQKRPHHIPLLYILDFKNLIKLIQFQSQSINFNVNVYLNYQIYSFHF